MPRLSDKHIAAIRAAAEDNDQTYGFGDVILLCDELQERRTSEGPWKPTAPDLSTSDARHLLKELVKCVQEKEPLMDADVLALFHALRGQGYFQTLVPVNREALANLIRALSTPEQPHLILEMQHTRGLPGGSGNPIDQLIMDLREVVHAPAQSD